VDHLEAKLSGPEVGEYRLLLAAALKNARNYDGSEPACKSVLGTLIDLEEWMKSVFGVGQEKTLSGEQELAIGKMMGAGTWTIDSVLGVASEKLANVFSGNTSLEEVLSKLNVLQKTVKGVLVPPKAEEMHTGDGNGDWKEPEFEQRIESLISALQQSDIYTDDLIITRGTVEDTMMRQESYYLIEIPKIGREVLMCNQVGEATFVSSRHLGMETYMRCTKEELERISGVVRITSRGQDTLIEDVIRVLLEDVLEDVRKVDVRDVEEVRAEIKKQYPTGAQWMGMGKKERNDFGVAGKGEVSLSTTLGVRLKHNPCDNTYSHALLGAVIYGSEIPEIRDVIKQEEEWLELIKDPEKIKAKVKKQYPTGAKWMEMSKKERGDIKIAGRGENAFATAILGMRPECSPCDNTYSHALLGAVIYGSEIPEIRDVIKQEEEWLELIKDPEKIKAKVKEQYPTGAQWMEMGREERNKFKIVGRGENSLAIALGMRLERSASHNMYSHALLGAVIYGSEIPEIRDVIKQEEEWLELIKDPEKIKAKVKKQYPTGAKWMEMGKGERHAFKIAGKGEKKLATALGMQTALKPCHNMHNHALLGAVIYGSEIPEIRDVIKQEEEWLELIKDPEKIKAKVKEQYPTGAQWMEMGLEQRHSFKIAGRGERRLATALGMQHKCSPCNNVHTHALLGAVIYGSEIPEIQVAIEQK
jgi:predicted membrane channel-forming protein YqfA (hemolysin III family)